MGEHVVHALDAEVLHVDCRPMAEWATETHRVHAREHAAHGDQHLAPVEIGRAAAAPRKQREMEISRVAQAAAWLVAERRNHRQALAREIEGELVLLAQRRVGPAQRAVELRDQRLAVLDADLVDAILIAVQRQQATVGDEALALDRRQDEVRREGLEGMEDGGVQRRSLATSAATWSSAGSTTSRVSDGRPNTR